MTRGLEILAGDFHSVNALWERGRLPSEGIHCVPILSECRDGLCEYRYCALTMLGACGVVVGIVRIRWMGD